MGSFCSINAMCTMKKKIETCLGLGWTIHLVYIYHVMGHVSIHDCLSSVSLGQKIPPVLQLQHKLTPYETVF